MPRAASRIQSFHWLRTVKLAIALLTLCSFLEAQVIHGFWTKLEVLRPGTKLAVTLMDHSRAKGRFAQVAADSLTLRSNGREVSIPRNNVLKIDSVSRLKGLGWGVLVGGGTGFVVGAINDIGPNEGGEGALGRKMFGSLGLIIGAIAGTAHKKRRTLYRATSLEKQAILAATRDAEDWLTLLDEREYARAWAEASEFLRDADVEQAGLGRVDTAQRRDGKLILRKAKAVKFHKTLPKLAGGPYVTIDFVTNYESKKSTEESLTLVQGEPRWRVASFSEITLR